MGKRKTFAPEAVTAVREASDVVPLGEVRAQAMATALVRDVPGLESVEEVSERLLVIDTALREGVEKACKEYALAPSVVSAWLDNPADLQVQAARLRIETELKDAFSRVGMKALAHVEKALDAGHDGFYADGTKKSLSAKDAAVIFAMAVDKLVALQGKTRKGGLRVSGPVQLNFGVTRAASQKAETGGEEGSPD